MHNKRIILAALGVLFLSSAAWAQSKQDTTVTIRVLGNCGMCEKRIEAAAYGKGVKSADWNVDTDMLTVTYKKNKTDLAAIEKRIAAVGHDTEHFRAPDAVYEKLHGCCHYDRSGQ